MSASSSTTRIRARSFIPCSYHRNRAIPAARGDCAVVAGSYRRAPRRYRTLLDLVVRRLGHEPVACATKHRSCRRLGVDAAVIEPGDEAGLARSRMCCVRTNVPCSSRASTRPRAILALEPAAYPVGPSRLRTRTCARDRAGTRPAAGRSGDLTVVLVTSTARAAATDSASVLAALLVGCGSDSKQSATTATTATAANVANVAPGELTPSRARSPRSSRSRTRRERRAGIRLHRAEGRQVGRKGRHRDRRQPRRIRSFHHCEPLEATTFALRRTRKAGADLWEGGISKAGVGVGRGVIYDDTYTKIATVKAG